jgi:hypothetical protein
MVLKFDGQYQPDIYWRQMKEFLARSLPWMAGLLKEGRALGNAENQP